MEATKQVYRAIPARREKTTGARVGFRRSRRHQAPRANFIVWKFRLRGKDRRVGLLRLPWLVIAAFVLG